MKKRILSSLLALGLVSGLFVGAVTTGSASGHGDYEDFANQIFFPTAHDGADVNGTGPWYTNLTVQNLENSRLHIEFSNYVGGDVVSTTTLQPNASKTFSAGSVNGGVETGPVVATAYWAPQGDDSAPCEDGGEQTRTITRGDDDADGEDEVETASEASNINVEGYDENVDYTIDDDDVDDEGFTIDWSLGGDEPEGDSDYVVTFELDVNCLYEPHIAGYAKQSSPDNMTADSRTGAGHETVDGYNALPVEDVAWSPNTEFSNLGLTVLGIPLGAIDDAGWDGHSYLPIVQTNSEWNSIVNLSHIDGSDGSSNASATIRFYETGTGEGSGNPPGTTIQLNPGETASVDLADYVDEGFVGSAWITADYGVVSNVERVKAETNMMVVNESAPSLFDFTVEGAETGDSAQPAQIGADFPELYESYAPLVFSGHNGWNSGFSVQNIAEIQNTVNVQVLNQGGNSVFADTLTIPAKGQEYIYMPNTQDLGLEPGFVGQVVFSSVLPFHGAVDQVKYSTGEAMSYIATQSGAQNLFGEGEGFPEFGQGYRKLAFPLIQKGNEETGLNDTSGIQLFNGTSDDSVGDGGALEARVYFYDGAGNFAPPTSGSGLGMPVDLGTKEGGTIYTMDLGQMSSSVPHSAVAEVTAGDGVLYGVTNNVNYAVDGDGAVAWNGVNSFGQFRTWSGGFFEGFEID